MIKLFFTLSTALGILFFEYSGFAMNTEAVSKQKNSNTQESPTNDIDFHVNTVNLNNKDSSLKSASFLGTKATSDNLKHFLKNIGEQKIEFNRLIICTRSGISAKSPYLITVWESPSDLFPSYFIASGAVNFSRCLSKHKPSPSDQTNKKTIPDPKPKNQKKRITVFDVIYATRTPNTPHQDGNPLVTPVDLIANRQNGYTTQTILESLNWDTNQSYIYKYETHNQSFIKIQKTDNPKTYKIFVPKMRGSDKPDYTLLETYVVIGTIEQLSVE